MRSLKDEVLALQRCEPQAIRNPYAIFNRARDEVAVLDYGPAVLITRFDDVDTVFRDQVTFSSAVSDGPYFQDMYNRLSEEQRPMFRFMMDWENASLGRVDDPVHAHRRNPIAKAMTAQRVNSLRGSIERRCDQLLDEITSQNGPVDIVDAFAYRLPLLVVAELIGIPLDNYEQLRLWAADWFAWKGNLAELPRSYKGTHDFVNWLETLFVQRRAMTNPPDDLLTAMMSKESALTDAELQVNVLAVISGGFETTTNLIGSSMLNFCKHPEQLAYIREDLNRLPAAIEEVLRFEPPLHSMGRLTTVDTELSGVRIPKGKSLLNVIAAANRDPAKFESPDKFDVSRTPMRITSFGVVRGPHFCPGSPLARLEAKVALTKVLERFPRFELLVDEPEWNEHYILRGLKRLPMRFHTH
jgi:pimeloyl-[acyl-carrier protein] synthase